MLVHRDKQLVALILQLSAIKLLQKKRLFLGNISTFFLLFHKGFFLSTNMHKNRWMENHLLTLLCVICQKLLPVSLLTFVGL